MNATNFKKRLLWSLVLAFSAISYIFTLYPAWMISFGYVFFALLIWIIIKNFKNYKFKKTDLICLAVCLALISIFVGRFYILSKNEINIILNTSYPGNRVSTGGKGIQYLFSYAYSFFLPFMQTEDNMLYASMLSFFPVPLIMGMIYVYKKEKNYDFLMPLMIVSVLESIWCISGLPSFLAKITLLQFVPVERCAVAVALASIYMYIYIISNIDEKFISLSNTMKITIALLIVFFCISRPYPLENSKGYMYLFSAIMAMAFFMCLNCTDKRYVKIFLGIALIWTLVSGIFVNPITKGTSIITKTKLANAIQKEVAENPDAVWITENMDMVVSNYLVANGAKTLNSTNTYPNEEFWKKVLGDKLEENREIWNRYAHIRIKLTDQETSLSLDGEDRIIINLNYEKLKDLNVNYIVSYNGKIAENLANNASLKLDKIYKNEIRNSKNIDGEQISGIYIYEFVN